jgi:hypothetical protein
VKINLIICVFVHLYFINFKRKIYEREVFYGMHGLGVYINFSWCTFFGKKPFILLTKIMGGTPIVPVFLYIIPTNPCHYNALAFKSLETVEN